MRTIGADLSRSLEIGFTQEVTGLLLNPVFEHVAADCPVSVMLRATLEQGLAPQPLDQLFAATADQQYRRELLFSTLHGERPSRGV